MPSVDTEAAFSDHEVEYEVSTIFSKSFCWSFVIVVFFIFHVHRTQNNQSSDSDGTEGYTKLRFELVMKDVC
jgi:heme/copper-type cytochrome/quinol oxidase subunit 2